PGTQATTHCLLSTDELGQRIPVTPDLAAQCGFTSGTDLYGNPEIRISFLACSVHNSFDQDFSLQLQVEVTSPANVTDAYDVSMKCSLDAPWSPREIACEENYMEVSVKREVPGIASEALNKDWMAVWPVAQGAMNQVWQVIFHFQNGSLQRMMATQAHALGYGVNTTATRVLFRMPYGSPQAEITMVQGLEVEVARATVFYKQAWMILMVNTALACPVGPPLFTATTLSWVTPWIMSSLVRFPDLYHDEAIAMGLDGCRIDEATIMRNGYAFVMDSNVITITVPIGAAGGLTESDVVDNHYGTTYSIKLLLDRRWQGDDSDHTRLRSLKSFRTPFAPQTPLLVDNTIPERGYFDVSLGSFLPDVELSTIAVAGQPLTPEGLRRRGFRLEEVPKPNRTRAFVLQVPFADSLVEQQYLHSNVRRYTLHLYYTLKLVTKDKTFTHPGVIHCDIPDVVLPTFERICDAGALGLVMTRGNLDHFWIPYVGSQQLTSRLAALQNYTVQDDGSRFYLLVPFLAPGLVYEDISLQGVTARLDFSLRDNKTLATILTFPVACIFPTGRLLACLSNGTMAATVLGLDTKPALDPRRTHLRDKNCGPVAADESKALFSFPVASCGTTKRFEGNYLLYENEVTFREERIPQASPVITRDSQYRLTLRCHYPLNETLRVWARRFQGEWATPVSYGLGPRVYQQKRAADHWIISQTASRASEGAVGTRWCWLPAFSAALSGVAAIVGMLPVRFLGQECN
ncbi:Zona pellucida sperm-binding protein 2, partial [Varanus komodoensis]